MPDPLARLAGEEGVLVPVSSDAHSVGALRYPELGIGQARRAWLTKKHVLNTRSWAQIERTLGGMNDFREDGREALEWAARYLERAGELPVLAQVEPGAVRSRLPASPPEQGEPFSAVLRDVEEILLPAMTHWQSPRYFGYFAISSSEPAILAELLAATLNQNAILWRTSPASTELEGVVLDWVAELLALPAGWHGHIEDTASTSTLVALAGARELAPTAASSWPPSTRTLPSRRP